MDKLNIIINQHDIRSLGYPRTYVRGRSKAQITGIVYVGQGTADNHQILEFIAQPHIDSSGSLVDDNTIKDIVSIGMERLQHTLNQITPDYRRDSGKEFIHYSTL